VDISEKELSIERFSDPAWERLVLGNALTWKAGAIRILTELSDEDFTVPHHRAAFRAFAEMFELGSEPTMTNLLVFLKERGRLAEVLGISGVIDLTENCVELMDLTGSIRVLRGKTLDREAYRLSLQIQEQCSRGYTMASDAVTQTQDKLRRLTEGFSPTEARETLGDSLNAIGGPNTLFAKPEGVISTPWPMLDAHIAGGLKRGEFALLAARPGVGKSIAALQIAYRAAKGGAKVRLYSLEMPQAAIFKRLISMVGAISHDDLVAGKLDAAGRRTALVVMSAVSDYPLAIVDDHFKFNEIMADIARAKPDLTIIDYLGLIETSGHFENRNQEISYLSRRLKQCAAQQDIPLLVLSQLSRLSDIEARKPRASDLRDSGSLEQDADLILFLHRPSSMKRGGSEAPRDQVQMLVEKQRNGARDLCLYMQMQGNFCRIVETVQEREN
jgi:replicative DNA helicase